VRYLREQGFDAVAVYEEDMAALKEQYMVMQTLSSCHTSVIEGSGYVVEGHVPVEAIDRLLASKPDIDGIALPGMPAGSPGMGGRQRAPFRILTMHEGRAALFMLIPAD
jgi:hypothetical protein